MTQKISEKNFLSASGAFPEEYRRQLALLIETPVGTVVLDREFGVDISCLDNPPHTAQAQLAGQLAEKIEKYIPDLELVEVGLESMDQEGNLRLKVVVDYAEPV